MPMKRCSQGHYYDPEIHHSCDKCGIPDLDIRGTKPKREPAAGMVLTPDERSDKPTDKLDIQKTHAQGQPAKNRAEEGQTVGIFRKKIGSDPVVGWLVCIEGPDRGRDYRIRAEKNFVGRSEKMHICIQNDESISRDNHASISYNFKKHTFKIHPGESRGLVYLNDEDVDVPTELKSYDIIELGQTKLMFIPFCGEKFQWS